MSNKHTNKPLPEGAVISSPFKRSSKIGGLLKTTRPRSKKMYLIFGLVLVVAAGTVTLVLIKRSNKPSTNSNSDAAYLISDKDYAKAQASEFTKNPVAATASNEDKLSYYDSLIEYRFVSEDYRGTVDAYNEAIKAVKDGTLTLNSYISTAKAYAKLGDKKTALTLLDKAQSTVQSQTTDKELLKSLLAAIDETKKEIGV